MVAQDISPSAFLETPEGEISFFRSIMRARPVGMHRHFHVLTIRNAIHRDTGHLIATEDIWAKLKTCYNLDALEALEQEGYEVNPKSRNSTPASIPSPSPSNVLHSHPFFRQEFIFPPDASYEHLLDSRRLRASASASPPSSPASSPSLNVPQTRSARKERRKSKLDLAGLISGDSDSSALTQESGDEGVPTPRESVGDDPGTDYAEEEDIEVRDPSPDPSASSKPTRGKGSKPGKRGGPGRGRGGSSGTSTRGGWKKKKK